MKKFISMLLAVISVCMIFTVSVAAAADVQEYPDWVLPEEEIYYLLATYKAIYSEESATTAAYQRASVTQEDLAEFYAAALAIDNTFSDYFSSSSYVIRSDGGAYKLVVKSGGELYKKRTDIANSYMARHMHAASLFIDKYRNHAAFDNEASLHAQFMCHCASLGSDWEKTTWHLEPWRTETNAVVLLRYQCNA